MPLLEAASNSIKESALPSKKASMHLLSPVPQLTVAAKIRPAVVLPVPLGPEKR